MSKWELGFELSNTPNSIPKTTKSKSCKGFTLLVKKRERIIQKA
jgi:hypothetical protein